MVKSVQRNKTKIQIFHKLYIYNILMFGLKKKHPVYIYTYIYIIYTYILLQYFISSLHLHFFHIIIYCCSQALYFVIFFCLYCFGLNTKNRPDFFGTRCTTKTNNVKNIYSRKYDGLLSRNIALCHTKMCAVSRVFVVFC